jgi:spermidine synthase
MIVFVSKVLIVGGGDGGVIREVVKHPQVEEVILCEIDQVKFYY